MMEWLREMLFLPPGVGSMADDLDGLHFAVIGTTMFGALVVFLVSVWYSIRYRQRVPRQATERVQAPNWLEYLVAGGLLSLFIAFWLVGYRQYVEIRQQPGDAMVIHVVAKQWMWKFTFPGGRRSQGVLVIPRGRNVQLRTTSRDVIHSFYVPSMRIKQDVLPGRTRRMWFRAERTGTYPILCAEYCGLNHSRMRATVVVLDPSEYARWLDGEVVAAVDAAGGSFEDGETMAIQGRDLASRYECFACHTVDGQEHIGPTWRGLYGSTVELADGRTVIATDDYLTESMMDPEIERVAGFERVMPSYEGVLSATEVAAIVEFIRSLEREGPPPAVNLPPVEPLAEGTSADGGVMESAAPGAELDGGAPRDTVADAGVAR